MLSTRRRSFIIFFSFFYLTSITDIHSAPAGTSKDQIVQVSTLATSDFEPEATTQTEGVPQEVTTELEPDNKVTTEPDELKHRSQDLNNLETLKELAVNQSSKEVTTESEPDSDQLQQTTESAQNQTEEEETRSSPVRNSTKEVKLEPDSHLLQETTEAEPVHSTTEELSSKSGQKLTEAEPEHIQKQEVTTESDKNQTEEEEGRSALVHNSTKEVKLEPNSHQLQETTEESAHSTTEKLSHEPTQTLPETESDDIQKQEVTTESDKNQTEEEEGRSALVHNSTKEVKLEPDSDLLQETTEAEPVHSTTEKLSHEPTQTLPETESDHFQKQEMTTEPPQNQTEEEVALSTLVHNLTKKVKLEPDHNQEQEVTEAESVHSSVSAKDETEMSTENTAAHQSTQEAVTDNEPVNHSNPHATETDNQSSQETTTESARTESHESETETQSIHLQEQEVTTVSETNDEMPLRERAASTTSDGSNETTTSEPHLFDSTISNTTTNPNKSPEQEFRHVLSTVHSNISETTTESNEPTTGMPEVISSTDQQKSIEDLVTDSSSVPSSREPVNDRANIRSEEPIATENATTEEPSITTMKGLSPRHLDDLEDVVTKEENWTLSTSESSMNHNEVETELTAKVIKSSIVTSNDKVSKEPSTTEEATGLESRIAHNTETEFPLFSETMPLNSDNVTASVYDSTLELTDRSIEHAIHTMVKNLLSETTIDAEYSSTTESFGESSSSRDSERNDSNVVSSTTTKVINEPTSIKVETSTSGEVFFRNTPLEGLVNQSSITSFDLTTVASFLGPAPQPSIVDLVTYQPIRHEKSKCTHYGRQYATGEHVEQQDPCHFCVCVNGYVDCYWKNCPPPPEGCIQLDFDGVCDRSLYLCPIPKRGEPLPFPVNSIPTIHRRSIDDEKLTCDILGVEYKVGELVGVASDPCMECRCALDSLYCSPKCCFQPSEPNPDPEKNSRSNDALWQPVLANPLKHLRYEFEKHYSERK